MALQDFLVDAFARLTAAINAVDAKTGGGGGQQVFVQQARPNTAGPWSWWKTDASGKIINLIVNDGNP